MQYLSSKPPLGCVDKQAGIPLAERHCPLRHIAAQHLTHCVEDNHLERRVGHEGVEKRGFPHCTVLTVLSCSAQMCLPKGAVWGRGPGATCRQERRGHHGVGGS